ncbi:MAG: ThuA domain-containing protein [Acidobacteriota bacterium]
MLRKLSLPLFAVVVLAIAATTVAAPLDVLVFTRTEGFAHPSIADGVTMIQQIASEEGHSVTVTDQTTVFTPVGLGAFDVVVWLSTTGDVLDAPEQAAFEGFIQSGGGYVGIHAAADCEYGWPWYGELLGNGAWFLSHPAIQTATLELEAPTHPGAGFTAPTTSFEDEWYNFRANPRSVVEVVLTLDEDSYNPGSGAMGDDHPIAWAHDFDGGRAFYTALGHRSETFQDSRFKEQIRGALAWAAGELFLDGFEAGNTSAWDSTVQRQGKAAAGAQPGDG